MQVKTFTLFQLLILISITEDDPDDGMIANIGIDNIAIDDILVENVDWHGKNVSGEDI